MRLTVGCCIAAGIALAGTSVFAATRMHPVLPSAEVPAMQLSAGSSQDMDQEFLNLLQLLGPDGDDLVRGAVDLPDSVNIDGEDFDLLNPESLPPGLGDDLGDFTIPPALWSGIIEQSG
jgi:hypothetical protein